jgi:hypothetical protein
MTKPSYLTVELLQKAKRQVRESSLYARFIDGTPLENDIACWMAEFAGQALHDAATVQEIPIARPPEADPHSTEWYERMAAAEDGHDVSATTDRPPDEFRLACRCQCCNHSEGSDCGCECHSTGLCAAVIPSSPSAPDREAKK